MTQKRVFFPLYRVAKYIYKKLPIPFKLKQKVTNKLVVFLELYEPQILASRNSSADLKVYDLFRDKYASVLLQDMLFPKEAESAVRVMIILVPYHNVMSGGIYSMFSIATHAKQLKSLHGWEVLVMTYPNPLELTYIRNRHFINCVDVFRFSQIFRLKNSKEIYIHLPEYAAATFLDDISLGEKDFLMSKQSVFINILNQNIRLMPPQEKIALLKKNFTRVGQSVAHDAYYGESFVQKYRLDSMLLPAYTDLSNYLPLPIERKEKLIIYSSDFSPHKDKCLARLRFNFPDFKFVEIFDITFDKYMDYASKCLFSISFGEGFDGYIAQPILMGGIGFTVYNDEFFPSSDFLNFYNIFDSEETMIKELPLRIRKLLDEPVLYKSLNSKLQAIYHEMYNKDDYISRIKNLCEMKYDLLYKDSLD